MDNNFEKPNRIDELEKKLYSPNQSLEPKERKQLRPQEYDVAKDWQSENRDIGDVASVMGEKKPNWFLRFLIAALVFFFGAMGFAGYKIFINSGIDASNIDILINAPLTIGAGEVFAFETVFQNKNQMPIKYVDVQIEFPDGTRSVSNIGTDYKGEKEVIPNINIGELVKRNYSALLFGEEGEKKEIKVFLTYQADGTTALLKKEKNFDVVLKSTPIRLTVTNVKGITSGQELSFTVELVSNSTQTLKNVMVKAVYPYGFIYKNSTLSPKEDKSSWVIPSLAPKEAVTFKVNGIIEGQNKDDKFFKFIVGLENEEKKDLEVVFSTKDTVVSLERPFLELDFAIERNNSDVIVLDPDRAQSASVSFKNNTNFPLYNADISLSIGGNALKKDSIQVNEGFYQSLNNSISWDHTTSDKLGSLPIGTSGYLNFNFIGNGLLSGNILINPESLITIKAKANRSLESDVDDIIENQIIKKIRFNTQVGIEASSEFYSSKFSNSGPIPPLVEQKTTYTGLISISNTSNIVTNGIVTMRVPNYAKYEGNFSPVTENVSYDPVTRRITWNVGDIGTKVGYESNPPRVLSLSMSIIPSISQVGQSPILIDQIKFVGTDTFTQKEINYSASAITTAINDAKDYYSSQVSK